MTQHPTPAQVQLIIDNLKSIEEQANQPGAFNIDQASVATHNHACGTVHCVAGWYAVACQQRSEHIVMQIAKKRCTYKDGARLMAIHLGFCRIGKLEDYMMNCPDIWGNEHGAVMFYELRAYTGLKFSSKPMTTIINHWAKVRDNLVIAHKRLATSAIDSR